MKKGFYLIIFLLIAVFDGCIDSKEKLLQPVEDKEAKAGMQGIWVDADEGNVVFRINGDSIYYPDSASASVKFMINEDTLYLYGVNVSKYLITKRTADTFRFKNVSGDIVELVRSHNESDSLAFVTKPGISLNQRKTIKRDTVVVCNNNRYHCYVQVNPTTYKVFKTNYNDEGIAVENIYYDNTIHVSIFKDGTKIYSKDFAKKDFAGKVPSSFLKQTILSDIHLMHADDTGVLYTAELAVPDSYTSFIVDVNVMYNGTMTMKIKN